MRKNSKIISNISILLICLLVCIKISDDTNLMTQVNNYKSIASQIFILYLFSHIIAIPILIELKKDQKIGPKFKVLAKYIPITLFQQMKQC